MSLRELVDQWGAPCLTWSSQGWPTLSRKANIVKGISGTSQLIDLGQANLVQLVDTRFASSKKINAQFSISYS
jgi:hypothetical protein